MNWMEITGLVAATITIGGFLLWIGKQVWTWSEKQKQDYIQFKNDMTNTANKMTNITRRTDFGILIFSRVIRNLLIVAVGGAIFWVASMILGNHYSRIQSNYGEILRIPDGIPLNEIPFEIYFFLALILIFALLVFWLLIACQKAIQRTFFYLDLIDEKFQEQVEQHTKRS